MVSPELFLADKTGIASHLALVIRVELAFTDAFVNLSNPYSTTEPVK